MTSMPTVAKIELEHGQAWLPPAVKVVGISRPNVDVPRWSMLTLTLPTGSPEPYFGYHGTGCVRLHEPHNPEFFPMRDALVSVAAGMRVMGAELTRPRTDWFVAQNEAFRMLRRAPSLRSILQELQVFEGRVLKLAPGGELEEYWQLDPLHYYELALMLVEAACSRHKIQYARNNVLSAFRYWWDATLQRYKSFDSPAAKQVREAHLQHMELLAQLCAQPANS
jgi:hypothetical protein